MLRFQKEAERANLFVNLKEIRTIKEAMREPQTKRLYALNVVSHTNANQTGVNLNDSLPLQSLNPTDVDWHLKKSMVHTNDKNDPNVRKYMSKLRSSSVAHNLSYPTAIRISS